MTFSVMPEPQTAPAAHGEAARQNSRLEAHAEDGIGRHIEQERSVAAQYPISKASLPKLTSTATTLPSGLRNATLEVSRRVQDVRCDAPCAALDQRLNVW